MATGIHPQEAVSFPAPTTNIEIQIRRAVATGPVSVQFVVFNTVTKVAIGAGSVPLLNAQPNYSEVFIPASTPYTVQNLSDSISIAVQ